MDEDDEDLKPPGMETDEEGKQVDLCFILVIAVKCHVQINLDIHN